MIATDRTNHRPRSDTHSRRQFLRGLTAGAAALAGAAKSLSAIAGEVAPHRPAVTSAGLPVSGTMTREAEAFEPALLELICEGEVSGALMCVSKNGATVFNRAYGWINPAKRIPLPVNARIGLASLDKVITSTAVDLLCRKNAAVPGTKHVVSKTLKPFVVFQQLGIAPADGIVRDKRLLDVTVDHLLQHQAGLDESVHEAAKVQEDLRLNHLATPRDSIAYLFHRPLAHDPGSESKYNSAGYFVLRFLVDLVGKGFVPFLQKEVFGPAGTHDICLSRARPALRDPLEMRYQCANEGPSIFPADGGAVIPEIEGGLGRYVDNHLVLATSAQALVKYMDYWFFGTADRLWTSRPGELTPGLNNGGGVYNGGMVGIRTGMQQRRWTMCNYAILTNWVRERPDVKPQDFHARMDQVLRSLGW